jgi:hypothetical protein
MITSAEADLLAQRAHGRDLNRAGLLFIDHVRRVAARMDGDPDGHAVPAALLHDSVEKGSIGWAELRAAGADERLIALIDALTERDGEADVDYLARCAADPLALRIKRADIHDKFAVLDGAGLPPAHREELHGRATRRLILLESLATPT